MPFSVGNHLLPHKDEAEALTYPTFAAARQALVEELLDKAVWACVGCMSHNTAEVCEPGCTCAYENAAHEVGGWSAPGTVQVGACVYHITTISEQEFVSTQVTQTAIEGKDAVADVVARIIAARWHGGQDTALYAFTSTGAIDRPRLKAEIHRCQKQAYQNGDLDALGPLEVLREYLDAAGRPPVPGWSENSWE